MNATHAPTPPSCIADRTEADLIRCYLDYVNNYITAARFGEAYGLKSWEAVKVINAGRIAHEASVIST